MGMKQVELCRIIQSDRASECHMYLRELDGGRVFPVIVHQTEMAEIYRKVHGESTRRPMTHDLFASLVHATALTLENVQVTEVRDQVFYARMNFEADDGRSFSIDARPSDAVAIATGMSCPIYAAEKILDDIGAVESPPEEPQQQADGENSSEDD
ncbi:MAG: bifunctional DNase/RNase [Pseudohongiellaceae bacterium]|jgi:bifunctional DNase/RNase